MVEPSPDGAPPHFLVNSSNCEGCGKKDVSTRLLVVKGSSTLLWVCADCYPRMIKLGAKDLKRLQQ